MHAAAASAARDWPGHRAGIALVLVAGVLWSTVGLGIRMIEAATVWQILLYRSASLSTLVCLVLLVRRGPPPLARIRAAGLPGLLGGLALVMAYSGGIHAIQTTTVANAMLLFAAAPFMAAVLGLALLGERVRRATWAAIVAAVAGIGVMVSDTGAGGSVEGSIAALISALGFALFTVALRWGRAGDMLPAVLISGLLAMAITATICVASGLPLLLSPRDAGVALGMGVFQVGAGLVCYTLGSRTVPAAELALLSMAEVLLGPLWVWLALGETAGRETLIGGAILLAAIAWNALSGARRKPVTIAPP